MTCAGVHRELNARVKSVGHSSFTSEEAEQMKATDNDQMNALYMARYSPSSERLRRPVDNRDAGLVRAWIHRKYQDRAWYGGGGNEQHQQQQRPPANQRQQRPATEPQPTVVQIPSGKHPPPPQRKTPPRQAAVDLFADFSSAAHQQQPQPQQQQWDAFGNSAASAPKQQQQQSHQQQQQQSQQQQQQWDAFGNNTSPAPTPAPFQADFANFSAPAPTQSEAFPADFGSLQARQTQPDPFQQGPSVSQSQMADPFAQQQSGQLGQPQQFQPGGQQYVQPGQQQFPPFRQDGQHFGQNQAPQQPSQGGQQFGQFGPPQVQHPQQSFQAGQQFVQPQQHGQSGMMTSGQPTSGNAVQQINQQEAFGAGMPNQTANHQLQQQQNSGMMPHQSQSNQGLQPSVSVASAADAISAMNFHLETPAEEKKKAPSKFIEGQKVYYRSSSYSGEAEIVKVHLDDELKPFYTIKVNGKEKQTDETHLEADSPVGNGNLALLRQVTKVLESCSSEQLQKVLSFAKSLASENSGNSFSVNSIPNLPLSVPSSIGDSSGGAAASEAHGATPAVSQVGQQQPAPQQPPQSFSFPNNAQIVQQPQMNHYYAENAFIHSESQVPSSRSGQSKPNATDAFAGIPSPNMNKQSVEVNSGSLPSPNVIQQAPSVQAPVSMSHQNGSPMLPQDQSMPAHPQSQMSFQPQFQQQPLSQGQSMHPAQMPGQFQNQGFTQQQVYQHVNGVHPGHMQAQPQINNFQSQQPPPAPMEAPVSPKGNPFDFH